MRRWVVEFSTDKSWEKSHKVITIRACTLRGALKRAYRKIPKGHAIYQIATRCKGSILPQPTYDFLNGESLCPSKLLGAKS